MFQSEALTACDQLPLDVPWIEHNVWLAPLCLVSMTELVVESLKSL